MKKENFDMEKANIENAYKWNKEQIIGIDSKQEQDIKPYGLCVDSEELGKYGIGLQLFF